VPDYDNSLLLVIVGGALAALLAVLLAAALRARRRAREFGQPLPPHWRSLLQAKLPLYRRMPPELRTRLEPIVREFLDRVEFVGCQGLQITDEIRLVICVQACLLVAAHGASAYSSLHSVLVYPDEFVVDEADEDEAGVVTEGTRVLSGQTFETARIILSWRDVLETGTADDPYNVVLHEFAHYLDHSAGGVLTTPDSQHGSLESWHEVLEREYEALCDAIDRDEPTLIDPYGAEHLEEFFAVATETFFEAPHEMQQRHPHLYEELRAFYSLDPARWRT
jgi:Mlc titration factor MtfA (ptsG expression regulator)